MGRSGGRALSLTRSVTLADRLELADSFVARLVGLMFRGPLPPGTGLWLPRSNGIHMWFMRQRIDAVFLGRRGDDGARRVVRVRRGLRPWVGIVPYVRGADGVLELPVGTAAPGRVEPGDELVVEREGRRL